MGAADLVPANLRVAGLIWTLPSKPDVDQQVVVFTDHPARPRLGIHVNGPVRD